MPETKTIRRMQKKVEQLQYMVEYLTKKNSLLIDGIDVHGFPLVSTIRYQELKLQYDEALHIIYKYQEKMGPIKGYPQVHRKSPDV